MSVDPECWVPHPAVFPEFLHRGLSALAQATQWLPADMIAATIHDRLALYDYTSLNALGIRTVRDGIRWHRIERTSPLRFAADLLMVPSRQTGTGCLGHSPWLAG